MKNNKGFSLIEILAVVVILGIVMLIAVPAVSNYIISSRKSSYVSTVSSYMQTIRGEYEMKYYGSFLYDDEIMIVPIDLVELEQGASDSTPFGEYIYEKSYVVIVPERNTYQFYANIMDTAGYGVMMMPSNSVTRDALQKYENPDVIKNWSAYGNIYEEFLYNGKSYSFCEERNSENAKEGSTSKILVLSEGGC